MATRTPVVTFVFPAYASAYGSSGEHRVECVVPDYLVGLTAGEILDVLERHARRVAPDGHDHTAIGGRLLRAMGRLGDGAFPSAPDITPAARDAALADAIRDLHAAVPGRYTPAGGPATHAGYVAHLLGR